MKTFFNFIKKFIEYFKKMKKYFFGCDCENIDKKEILLQINKLKINFPNLNSDSEEIENLHDSLEVKKNPTFNTIKIQSKIRFPLCENGSFKSDINNFLDEPINSAIKKIFSKIELEINKVYKSYVTIENILFEKIIALINFYDKKEEFSKLQIISRIKEISEILEESFNFIINYLFRNFYLLKTVLNNMDENLTKLYTVKSLGLIFLLKYFELPNNELSYMLMFKIFDEETLILGYILNKLHKQIILNQNTLEANIMGIDNSAKFDSRESRIFNDQNEEDKNETLNIMLNLMSTYINKSKDRIKDINNIYIYRALYKNYLMYLKSNYNVDYKNRLLSSSAIAEEDGSSINSSELSDLISINSLMDEEVIIKHFLNKNIIIEFLSFFKKNLSIKYKINKFLIIIHCIQYYSIIPFIIMYNINKEFAKNAQDICLYLISFNFGIFINKIICSGCLSKKLSLKALLLISNFFLIISLCLLIIDKIKDVVGKKYLFIINRFLYGLSNSKLIESKFLVSSEPKLIVNKSIKFFFRLKYIAISIAIGFILIININFESIINIYNKIIFINSDLIKKIPHEFIFLHINFIILIINIILFRNIKIKDIFKKNEHYEKIIINKSQNTNFFNKKSSIFESANSEISKVSEDYRSVLSYGKSKLISYRNKRKAQLLDKHFRSYSNNENYEGTNQIFEEIYEMILKQKNCCSYINKISFGLLFIIICLNINNDMLILLMTLTDNYKINFLIFSIPYLIGFFSFNIKNAFFKEMKNNIGYLNLIILVVLIWEMILYLIMIIFILILDYNIYPILIISIIIAFLNIMIESFTTYLMSITIPIEKCIFKINIGNFIDISIVIFKSFSFLFIFYIDKYFYSSEALPFKNYQETFLLLCLSCFYSIFEIIIFYFFIYIINYTSISRIMNKLSYEK